MNKLEQLVHGLIKNKEKPPFNGSFIILASVFGAAGYAMLVVGLVIMEQNLVLYVTILVIGAVLGFAVCPCLVWRSLMSERTTSKCSLTKSAPSYSNKNISMGSQTAEKKNFQEHPFGLEEDKSSAICRGKLIVFPLSLSLMKEHDPLILYSI